jgi:hypothetical protein
VTEDTNPPRGNPDRTIPNGGAPPASLDHISARLFVFKPSDHPGDLGRLDRYRVLKQLGKGGMGAVYLGFDERLQRRVALKVMLPDAAGDPQAKDRFLREARAAAQIGHDNVIAIHEADEADGIPYIAMQYLQGYPLDEYLAKKGRPSFAQVIRIGREIALGLGAAHRLGLVHRDIKPGNVWLEAPHGRVKILDFGLAKPVRSNDGELTKSGTVVGTPAYMPPEQARGLTVDHRADLFSLGAVLYRLVTGKLPFDGPDVMAILTALAVEDPTPVWEVVPNAPRPLAELIHQLLAKKPANRPQTADEVSARLHTMMERQANPNAVTTNGNPGTGSQQVVYVPVPVTVMATAADNAFAHLEEEGPTTAETPTVVTRPKAAKASPKAMIGLLLAGVLTMVVGGFIVIKVVNPDGTTTELKVPDDAKVTVEKNGKKVFETVKPAAVDLGPFPKLDPEWVKSVAALPPTDALGPINEELKRRNPGYGGTGLAWVADPLLGTKTGLELRTDAVSDLTPLLAVPALEYLAIPHGGKEPSPLATLAPLRGLKKLRGLRLESHPLLKDLSPVQDLPLEHLAVLNCPVESLAPLKGMKLDRLEIHDTPALDLTPLANLPLRTVVLGLPEVRLDLSPLAGCPLEHVQFQWGRGTDLTPLRKCPLKTFKMIYTALPDLSPLEGTGIEHFSGFDPVQYESFLRTLPKLETVTSYTHPAPQPRAAFFAACEEYRRKADEFAAATAKLPVAEQVEAVRKKWAEQNGNGKPTLQATVENGHVVAVAFAGSDPHSNVWNLSFLRAFPKLKRIDARVFGYTPLFHQVLDLPIEEVHVADSTMHHSKALHSLAKLKHLKQVNGRPVEEYAREWGLYPAASKFPPPDPAWVKSVLALPVPDRTAVVIAELKRRNPDFDGRYEEFTDARVTIRSDALVDLTPLAAVPDVEYLDLAGPGPGARLTDLRPLRALKRLAELQLPGQRQLRDLSPLAGLPIRQLNLYATGVADLTPLRGLPLEELNVHGTQVADFGPLRGLPLKTLYFGRPDRAFDLSPLADTPLEALHVEEAQNLDLTPLKRTRLKNFQNRGVAFADYSPLEGSATIEHFAGVELDLFEPLLRTMPNLKTVAPSQTRRAIPAATFFAQSTERRAKREAFLVAVAQLPVAERVTAVKANLEEQNGKAIQFDTQLEDGEVVGITITAEHDAKPLWDLSPLRAFPKLRRFESYAFKSSQLYPLVDLPIEEVKFGGVYGYMNTNFWAFARMKSLKKVNGQDYAAFAREWKLPAR